MLLNKQTRPKNSVVNVKYGHGFVVPAGVVGRRPLQTTHIRLAARRRAGDPPIQQRRNYILQLDTLVPVSISR